MLAGDQGAARRGILRPARVSDGAYAPAVVAVYILAVPTCVVPFIHLYELPEDAVSITLPPVQNVVGAVVVIVAIGSAFTVKLTVFVLPV